jgi:tRNA pseudouridine55 synthase
MIEQTTKLARFWEDSEKSYEAVVRFGFATTTYDREGETVGPAVETHVTAEEIEAHLDAFRGEIDQKPPPVSAKKIAGVPAYKLARKNQPVDIPAVLVTVHELTLRSVKGDRANIFVRCSAGTYIRSIAHDLGIALGCGAHIHALVRTASGPFTIEKSFTLEQLQELKNEGHLEEVIVKPAGLLPHFPAVFVDDTTERLIRQGRDFTVSAFRVNAGAEHVKAIGPAGDLIAIGRVALPHVYHPIVVLNV